jgi:hypothetical protein
MEEVIPYLWSDPEPDTLLFESRTRIQKVWIYNTDRNLRFLLITKNGLTKIILKFSVPEPKPDGIPSKKDNAFGFTLNSNLSWGIKSETRITVIKSKGWFMVFHEPLSLKKNPDHTKFLVLISINCGWSARLSIEILNAELEQAQRRLLTIAIWQPILAGRGQGCQLLVWSILSLSSLWFSAW